MKHWLTMIDPGGNEYSINDMKIAVLSITLAVFITLLVGSAVWVYVNPDDHASLSQKHESETVESKTDSVTNSKATPNQLKEKKGCPCHH